MKANNNLAVIIPLFNEGSVLKDNFKQISNILKKENVSCSYLFVDDGSVDNTWDEISVIAKQHKNVSALRFARNFGKEAAIFAGLSRLNAATYLIMDSDLQHNPTHIREMLKLMKDESADIVNGVKIARGKESFAYRLFAGTFYYLMKIMTGLELKDSSDYKLLNRKVVDELRRFGETKLFIRGLVAWIGFKQVDYRFEIENRKIEKSRFSKRSLIQMAFNSVLAYTSKPLYLTIIFGVAFFLGSVILAFQTLYNYFKGFAISGFTTVILLLLLIGSMIMISLGIIGLYLSRIYDEVKKRPTYIVSESIRT